MYLVDIFVCRHRKYIKREYSLIQSMLKKEIGKERHIVILISNDFVFDDRMHKVAHSLVAHGFKVTVVGRKLDDGYHFDNFPFSVQLLSLPHRSGPLFYLDIAHYYLKALRAIPVIDIIWAVDLDTILPAIRYKSREKCKVIFDAHEWFEEVPELQDAPLKKYIWKSLGKYAVPKADLHITVNSSLQEILSEQYKRLFHVLHNMPTKKVNYGSRNEVDHVILYHGVFNEGRGLGELIKAAALRPQFEFLIIGKGPMKTELEQQARDIPNVTIQGPMSVEDAWPHMQRALIGVNLLVATSKNYLYSTANKFFNYVQAGLPVLTMNFPTYSALNQEYEVAHLIESLTVDNVVDAIDQLTSDLDKYRRLSENCQMARTSWTWEHDFSLVLDKITNI